MINAVNGFYIKDDYLIWIAGDNIQNKYNFLIKNITTKTNINKEYVKQLIKDIDDHFGIIVISQNWSFAAVDCARTFPLFWKETNNKIIILPQVKCIADKYESTIDKTLINEYDWELAKDTCTTWRIGDGTAGFYNYIYYTIAGFSEHDTFRSNQVREGVITRNKALELVEEENKPRYENIAEYLEMLDLDFKIVIDRINSVPRLWHQNPV